MSAVSTTRNRIEVMHGVNLDVLERRDPDVYGGLSLVELERMILRWGRELGLEVRFFQSNFEGEFVEHLHRLPEIADGALVNAGAWTHYSWAIRDALEIARVPVVEIHLSELSSREKWRQVSVLDGLVREKIQGKGPDGYRDGLELLGRELGAGEGEA
jgi:3-dehydroquinate dehydratase-2